MQNERTKGVILSYIQVILSVGVNIIYVPVLLHYLGQSEYGLYQIVGSFFSYVAVFESCMSTGVLRNYGNAIGADEPSEAAVTLSTAKRIYIIMSILMAGIGIMVLVMFRRFYSNSFSMEELNEGAAMLFLLFINMVITLLGSVYLTIITGHERFLFLKASGIVSQLLQPILVILMVRRIPYALTIAVVMVLLDLATVLLRYYYSRWKLGIKIPRYQKNDQILKEIIGLSAAILLGSIADQIFWKTDQVILGKLYSTTIVAIYSVGSQIYMIYMQFGTQIASIFYPRISVLYQQENGNQKISNLFVKVGRITSFIIMLILSGFIVFGQEFLNLWVGRGYTEAYYVAIVVMVPFSIDLAQNLGLAILQLKSQYAFRAKIYFLGAVLNIISTVFLASWIGIVGAALSTGITMTITSGFVMNWYYGRKAELDIIGFWKKTSPILATTLLLTIFSLVVKKMFFGNMCSIVRFATGVIVYTAIYLFVMYIFIMDRSEKNQIRTILIKRKD